MEINKTLLHLQLGGIAACALLAGGAAHAAQMEPKGMPFGPGFFFPSVGLDVRYDDNLLNGQNNTVDSVVTELSLGGRQEIRNDASMYALDAGLKKGWYNSSTDDNFLDGHAFAEGQFFPSSRVSAKVRGGFWRAHEDRGTTTLQGDLASLQDEPDVYNLLGLEGELAYGLEEVRTARIEGRASFQQREYQNNRLITELRDRDEAMLGATFKYMVMPATSLLVDGRIKDFSYKRNTAQLDSKEYRIEAGVSWEATAATTGYAKYGWQKKSFDSASREDDSKPAWDLGVTWTPLTYSAFGLSTSRKFDESTGTGDYVDRREVRVSWQHAWRSYITSDLFFSRTKEDYPGSTRKDELDGYGANLDYSMNETMAWQLYYEFKTRDSNGVDLNYDRNKFGLRMNWAL